MKLKQRVADFWDNSPCGVTNAEGLTPGTPEFFQQVEDTRYEREGFIPKYIGFSEWKEKSVLEIGCGIGIDFRHFVREGAQAVGIDVSQQSLKLAKQGSDIYGLNGTLILADGENLPFASDKFDLVYTWGVIHHAPDTSKVVDEIYRVLKPGGRVIAMVYNLRSLLVLQAWLFYGLLKAKPFSTARNLVANHVESPGTKAYTKDEATRLFGGFERVEIESVVTSYDLRIGRRRFFPSWVRKVVPSRFGWFTIVRGLKPAGSSLAEYTTDHSIDGGRPITAHIDQ